MKPILGFVLPTNTPSVMHKFLLPSLGNIVVAKDYIEFLINFQSPWDEKSISECLSKFDELGLHYKWEYHSYTVKGKGLVPINRIREDTAAIDETCEYYCLLDDDMTFLGSSPKMPRSSGEQLLEAMIYLKEHPDCGVFVFGNSLIKKIKRDSIAPIYYNRNYVTGRGVIFKNFSPSQGLLLPKGAHDLLGSDEEKVAAAYRISSGYYVAELPFARINHYESQVGARRKDGKLPGSEVYRWCDVREENNFKFIRENYSKDYQFKRGNIVELDHYIDMSDPKYFMDFEGKSTEDLIAELNSRR